MTCWIDEEERGERPHVLYKSTRRSFSHGMTLNSSHRMILISYSIHWSKQSIRPEIFTSGDDGVVKWWIIPAAINADSAHSPSSNITHRGHTGAVLSLAALPASQKFSNGSRALGDGWVFSGGQDATVRVW